MLPRNVPAPTPEALRADPRCTRVVAVWDDCASDSPVMGCAVAMTFISRLALINQGLCTPTGPAPNGPTQPSITAGDFSVRLRFTTGVLQVSVTSELHRCVLSLDLLVETVDQLLAADGVIGSLGQLLRSPRPPRVSVTSVARANAGLKQAGLAAAGTRAIDRLPEDAQRLAERADRARNAVALAKPLAPPATKDPIEPCRGATPPLPAAQSVNGLPGASGRSGSRANGPSR